eukprot:2596675-Rhodomonas_salina.3
MASQTRWLSSKCLLAFQVTMLAITASKAGFPSPAVAFVHPVPAILGRGRLHLAPQTSTFRESLKNRNGVCFLRASGSDSNEESSVSKSEENAGPSPEDWREFRAKLIARESDAGNQTVVRSVAKKNEE